MTTDAAPITKTIEALRFVQDLDDGQIALPKKDMTYVVYHIDGTQVELPVARVVRRGDHLYAISNAGVERCIGGEGAEFVIRGRHISRHRNR